VSNLLHTPKLHITAKIDKGYAWKGRDNVGDYLDGMVSIAAYATQKAHAAMLVITGMPILEKLRQAGGMKNTTAAGANMTK
jgi:hypothetical protein